MDKGKSTATGNDIAVEQSSPVPKLEKMLEGESRGESEIMADLALTSTRVSVSPNTVPSDFSKIEFQDWQDRIGWECEFPIEFKTFLEEYTFIDPTLMQQSELLIPFERCYIYQLVGIIVSTLIKTPASLVTPTLRAVVNLSWESLCRLGIKLPVLEKIVAKSQENPIDPSSLIDPATGNDIVVENSSPVPKLEKMLEGESSGESQIMADLALTNTSVSVSPNTVPSDFSKREFEEWLDQMGWECEFPYIFEGFLEVYNVIDPTLLKQTQLLILFERYYVYQLVGIIVKTLIKTPASLVTPTIRAVVNLSWESLCRLGIKLPVLEKMVAKSRENPIDPSPRIDPSVIVKELEKVLESHMSLSYEVESARRARCSKFAELKNYPLRHQRREAVEEIRSMDKFIIEKERELKNLKEVYMEKSHMLRTDYSFWCSFPEYPNLYNDLD